MCIEIIDDGVGIDNDKLHDIHKEIQTLKPKDCYGLINVCKRIKLEYGEKTDITIESQKGKDTLVRIEKSIEYLIQNPEMKLIEVSEKCGFSSQHYFSRIFKEKTGYPPIDYRKHILEKNN